MATLFLGSFLTYHFGIKIKQNERSYKYKEEKYQILLIKLQGFVGNTANATTKTEFFEEQYKSWLYCSDEVVEAINKMVTLVIDSRNIPIERKDGREAIGNIVLAMRKDLVGKKTKLNYQDFIYTDVV